KPRSGTPSPLGRGQTPPSAILLKKSAAESRNSGPTACTWLHDPATPRRADLRVSATVRCRLGDDKPHAHAAAFLAASVPGSPSQRSTPSGEPGFRPLRHDR